MQVHKGGTQVHAISGASLYNISYVIPTDPTSTFRKKIENENNCQQDSLFVRHGSMSSACSGAAAPVPLSGRYTTTSIRSVRARSRCRLPSRFLAFSLVALRVLGLGNKNSRAKRVNQPMQLVTTHSLLPWQSQVTEIVQRPLADTPRAVYVVSVHLSDGVCLRAQMRWALLPTSTAKNARTSALLYLTHQYRPSYTTAHT